MSAEVTLWHWIAWNKDRERICDCGTVRATSEAEAKATAWMCIGGPHMSAICSIEVRKVPDVRVV